ncbi:polyprenyl synthetase family protein [Desulfovibrio legallii]|jgi:octaprenyl-diphosphate synthase|uniref:Octaprenyl-diphosphate synthase n=1 Tax=Desulfovibrio legallii TaxID=571438 RepID=A0A1G7NXH8_9BACT|nr:polyprenyl synthetase family protein [Desulfovibrio legallii]SDF78069.1 octaprenyl-diphosphate synthase [Desulfovibrio legallii]
MIQLKARLALELPAINRALGRAVETLPASVRPVARHIFDAGGKRLRPVLTVLTARLLGCRRDDLQDLAVTLEMLHAATLLHDDVLDNAVSRRGQPAAHTVYDVGTVILAGDALLAGANAMVAGYGDTRLTRCFSEATSRTAAGEILEIEAQGRVDVGAAEYEEIIRGKTAWLIRASCEMGALAAGAEAPLAAAAAAYGENLGMAFQMVDDALDFAPESVTGKPTGGDVREGKLTPPLRLYRESLAETERAAFDAAFCTSLMTEDDAAAIAARIREAGFDAQVRCQAEGFLHAAREALHALPDRPERGLLLQMADYVRDRKK